MSETLQEFYDRHKDFVYSYILYVFAGNKRESGRLVRQVWDEFFDLVDQQSRNQSDDQLISLLRRRTRTYKQKYRRELLDMAPPASYQTRLQQTVGSLPQLQQDCVLFKYLYGLTPKPLAKTLDKTETSIRQNISRGTKRIFELMENDTLTSRTLRLPLAQIPTSIDQRIKIRFRPELSPVLYYQPILKRLGRFLAPLLRFQKRYFLFVGLLLLLVGFVGEVPKYIYAQQRIMPKGFGYEWKREMELTKIQKIHHPANLANYYLTLSNRRILEAYHLTKTPSLSALLWPSAQAAEIEFTIYPVTEIETGLLVESGLMIARAIEYTGQLQDPTLRISVLKNIRTTLKRQIGLLEHFVAESAPSSTLSQTARSLALAHRVHLHVVQKAGEDAAISSLDESISPVAIQPVQLKIQLLSPLDSNQKITQSKTQKIIADNIRIHRQFRPLVKSENESLKSYPEAVLELDPEIPMEFVSDDIPVETLIEQLNPHTETTSGPQDAQATELAEKEEVQKEPAVAPPPPKSTTQENTETKESTTVEPPQTESSPSLESAEPDEKIEAVEPPSATELETETTLKTTESLDDPVTKIEEPETIPTTEIPDAEETEAKIVEVESQTEPEAREEASTTEIPPAPSAEPVDTATTTEATPTAEPETPTQTEPPPTEEKEPVKDTKTHPAVRGMQHLDTEAIKSLSGDRSTTPKTVPVDIPEETAPELELEDESTEEPKPVESSE